MKRFKEKYMKGINIVQFIDSQTYDKLDGDLFFTAYGLNRAFIVSYEEEINIIIIKDCKMKVYFMENDSLPLLHELYDHLSSNFLSNFISNQIRKNGVYEITLKQFFDNNEKLAIHCATKKQANQLLKEFNKMGKTWVTGESYLESNRWNKFENKTVYNNYRMFGNIDDYYDDNISVYEFEDIIFEENKDGKKVL